MVGVVQRDDAAFVRVESKPAPGLRLGVRVGVNVQEVDRVPAAGDLGRVGE
jgi:hypothetical protein